MCDQTEISYLDEEVVWVKLGSEWWPGAVVGREKLPPDFLDSFKKPPIAVVKFFEEETFEYVKNLNSIYKYNCSRKHEFIKKGLDHHRSNKSHMEKFPADVSQAERLTDGDPDIVQREEFRAPSKRESYAGIFGDPPAAKKGTPASAKKGKNKASPISPTKTMQNITHPRILKKLKDGTSDYKAHILVQPSPTDNSRHISTASEHDDLPTHTPLSPLAHTTTNLSTPTPASTHTNTQHPYSCRSCPFTCARLNVMVLHNRSHSCTFTPYTPSRSLNKSAKVSPEKKTTPKNKKETPQAKSKPKARKVDLDMQPTSSRVATPQKTTESPPKRKGTKLKDKNVKKMKTDMEIKNSLLADWSEDSNDSMNLLTSLELKVNTNSTITNISERDSQIENEMHEDTTKVPEALEKVSQDVEGAPDDVEKVPEDIEIVPEDIEIVPEDVEKVQEDVGKVPEDVKAPSTEEMQDKKKAETEPEKAVAIVEVITKAVEKTKVDPVSCFDFQEDEDWPLEADVGRKIPRVNLKNDNEPLRKLSERDLDAEILEKRLSKEDNERKDEGRVPDRKGLLESREDLVSEIDHLLEETTVPQLPSVPQTYKFQENFPEPKTVKFPDKQNSKQDKPITKTIFKTKTFFRSRHCRSQDAIEKYVADNTAIDKPTWMEKSAEKDTDEVQSDYSMDSGEIAVESEVIDPELSLSLQLSPLKETVKIPKLAPKIQLKRMKANLMKDFYTEDDKIESENGVQMQKVLQPEIYVQSKEIDDETASAPANLPEPTNNETALCSSNLLDNIQISDAQTGEDGSESPTKINSFQTRAELPEEIENLPTEYSPEKADNISKEEHYCSTAQMIHSPVKEDCLTAEIENSSEQEINCPLNLNPLLEKEDSAEKEENDYLGVFDSPPENNKNAPVEDTQEKIYIQTDEVDVPPEGIIIDPAEVDMSAEEIEIPAGENKPSEEIGILPAEVDIPAQETDVYQAEVNIPVEETMIGPEEVEIPAGETMICPSEVGIPAQETMIGPEEVEIPAGETMICPAEVDIPAQETMIGPEVEIPAVETMICPAEVDIPAQETMIGPEEVEIPAEETRICPAEKNSLLEEKHICPAEVDIPSEELEICPAGKDISLEKSECISIPTERDISPQEVQIVSEVTNILPVKVDIHAEEIDIRPSEEVQISPEELNIPAAAVDYSTNDDYDQHKIDIVQEMPVLSNEVDENKQIDSVSYSIGAEDETDVLDQTDFSIKEVDRRSNAVVSVVPTTMEMGYLQESQLEMFEDSQGVGETMMEEFPDTPGAVEEVSVNTSEETEIEPKSFEPPNSDSDSHYYEEFPLRDKTIFSNGVPRIETPATIGNIDSGMLTSTALSIDTADLCNKIKIAEKSPTESDLQIAETLINLPASTINNISNVEENLQDMFTPRSDSEDLPKITSVGMKETTQTVDSSICSALSNAQEKNAAESLMQMFNTIEQPTKDIFASDVPELTPIRQGQGLMTAKNEFSFDFISEDKPVNEKTMEKAIEEKDPASTKLQQMLEAPSIPPQTRPANSTLKIISSKIIPSMSKEKIINFNTVKNESSLKTVNPQKQKIIIRRKTPAHKNSIEGISESRNKFILSSPSDRANSDSIPTYTIQNSGDPANIMLHPKTNKRNTKVKPQKLVSKPQSTIITSTGMLLKSGSTCETDDSIFDINSMPIVLSDEILTPENLERMPIVMTDGKVVAQQPKPTTTVKYVAKETEKVSVPEKSKSSPAVSTAKPEVVRNILLKPTAEKSTSPNILSKSSKIKSGKPMLIVDKNTGEQKIMMSKAELANISVNKDNKQMIFKHGPTLITQPGAGGKMEKFLILPPGTNQHLLSPSNKRQQPKIIVNPQTGKAHMLISKPADLPELCTSTASVSSVKPNTTNVFQNKQGGESTNTVMIITNPQGGQQKIVLTPEHEKMLFPKKSNLVTQQTIVTSKGGVLSPVRSTVDSAHSVSTSKVLITSTASTLMGKSQVIHSQSPKLMSKQRSQQSAIITSKGQLIIPGVGAKRTIYTTVPSQALLTSKGQLVTPQQIPMASTVTKILPSNVKSAPPTQLSKVGKVIPKVPKLQPQISKPLVTSSAGKSSTTFAPTHTKINLPSGTSTKEPMIILQQKNGNIMQLTAAQFEHLQKTGQLVHRPPTSTAAKLPVPKPQEQLKKYSNKSLKSEKNKTAPVPPIKHKLVAPPPLQPLEKKQRLRELLTFKQDAKNKLPPEPKPKYGLTSNPIPVPHVDLNNLDDLIPATLIDARNRDPSYSNKPNSSTKPLVSMKQEPSPEQPSPVKLEKLAINTNNEQQLSKFSAVTPSETSQTIVAPKIEEAPPPPVTENQLLAVPGDYFGCSPNSFYLCIEENGGFIPVDNKPLVLENNQLVPISQPEPIAIPPLAPQAHLHPEPTLDEKVQQMVTLPGNPHQNILINIGDQQIILDQQTLLSLLASDGQQQLITADGQQLVLQGNVQQLLQSLLPAQQQTPAGWTQQQQAPNRDILAAALANTDVFQQDIAVATCPPGAGETLSGTYHPPLVPDVSATSPARHLPIMTPVEVPTNKDPSDAPQLLGQDLEQSLAGIGVTAPNVPTTLELPITVTNPHIASKTTNPLNLSCGVYAGTAINNSLVSPSTLPDPEGRSNLVDYSTADTVTSECEVNSDLTLPVNVKYMNPGSEECELTSGLTHYRDELKTSRGSSGTNSIIGECNKETFNSGSEKASCSMPCLDDSSSDSFMEESTNVDTTIETKTYSPISMPILTEDSQDGQKLQYSSMGSKSMPSLLDDRSQDAQSAHHNVTTARPPLNMPHLMGEDSMEEQKDMQLQTNSHFAVDANIGSEHLQIPDASKNVEQSHDLTEAMDVSETNMDIQEDTICDEVVLDAGTIETMQMEVEHTALPAQSLVMEEFVEDHTVIEETPDMSCMHVDTELSSDKCVMASTSSCEIEETGVIEEPINGFSSVAYEHGRNNLQEEVETSSWSTQGSVGAELLTPDSIAPTPPPDSVESHPFSDTSTDGSDEIPIQPDISVSQQTVQHFSAMVNNNSLSPPEMTASPAPDRTSPASH